MVTLPATVEEPELIVPVVFITVLPVISELLPMVPELISGISKVLLLSVSTASRVAMVPAVGKVALELIPVPPALAGSSPVTAVACAKLMAPKVGEEPSLGTTKL